jgi:hypothetical protein
MGIKENGVAFKRRMSPPDSRKENGYINVDDEVIEVASPAKRVTVSRASPTRMNNAVPLITAPRVHHHLPITSQSMVSNSSYPLHPLNTNGSPNHRTPTNLRSALLEAETAREAANDQRAINGHASPKNIAVNGRHENMSDEQNQYDRTNASARSPNSIHPTLRTSSQQQRSPSDESVAPELLDDQFKNIYTVSSSHCSSFLELKFCMLQNNFSIVHERNELSCNI